MIKLLVIESISIEWVGSCYAVRIRIWLGEF
jgi:hypothetical protein